MSSYPPCPQGAFSLTYVDGTPLTDGDSVTVIKDLEVRVSSCVVIVGGHAPVTRG